MQKRRLRNYNVLSPYSSTVKIGTPPEGADVINSVKTIRILVLLVCLLLTASALIGLLWQREGFSQTVSAIDGREIELYGYGAYASFIVLGAVALVLNVRFMRKELIAVNG